MKPIIQVQNVSQRFDTPQGEFIALQNVSFDIQAGETVSLIGHSGCGKSTLLNLIAGLALPSEGVLLCDNQQITGPGPERGVVFQNHSLLPWLTTFENVALAVRQVFRGQMNKVEMREWIEHNLELVHMSHALDKRPHEISGGMKQRVGIAQSLLNDPAVLIVDEPTVGLDPEERIGFRNLLSSLSADRIILLSTHIVTDVESIAPQIAIIREGCLLKYDTPENLMKEVDGMVWSLVVPSSKLSELQKHLIISSSIGRSDGIHIRVVSAKQPSLDAAPAPPTLEDAYLFTAALKGGAA